MINPLSVALGALNRPPGSTLMSPRPGLPASVLKCLTETTSKAAGRDCVKTSAACAIASSTQSTVRRACTSVLRRRLRVVNDKDVDRRAAALEPQAELIPQGLEERRTALREWPSGW